MYDPLDWSQRNVNDSLFQFYTDLVSLRKDRESLRSEDLTVVKNDTTDHIFVYARGVTKGDPSDDDVVVALNFGNDRRGNKDVSVPLTKPGFWLEYLNEATLNVSSDGIITLDFAYSDGKIFIHLPHD